ncbi:replication protein [Bacillus sp. RO3]|nr:replication protein [Bacillus sp. RO3]
MARQPETKVKFSIFNKEFNQGIDEMSKHSTTLRKEFKLQEEQLKANGTETEKFDAKLSHLSKQYEIAEQKTKSAADQLAKAKEYYGDNSEEVRKLNDLLLGYKTSQQKLENQIASTTKQQEKYQRSLNDIEQLLKVTGTKAEDFAKSIGPELTEAIVKGTASTKQLNIAFGKLSKEALGTEADVQKVKKALSKLDDGSSIKSVRKDLGKLAKDADEAKNAVNDLGSEIGGLAGGIVAGGGIAGAVDQSLDLSSLKTKIDLTFEVPEKSKQEVLELVKNVVAYGVDAEAALEGVRRQWAMNKDVSDQVNASVAKGAAAIVASYEGIDFNELIQETNEVASALGISNQESLGLFNTLLKTGFPPEQLDIIAEYGTQLSLAGYSAEEIQNIFAAGVDTKSWNIDNLLDGLKEGRIGLAEFGLEVPKALSEVISKTDISETQLKKWGKAVADGGEKGKTAMFEASKALAKVEDGTLRNEIGVQMFGTMWEDQGSKIIETLVNAEKGTADLSEGVKGVSEASSTLDASPTVQLKDALNDLQIALEPVLSNVSSLITKIASWVSNNPQLAATILAVVSAVGILVGIFMALSPIITALVGLAGFFSVGLGTVSLVVVGVIAAIAALIAIGIALWKNWDTIMIWLTTIWTAIKATAVIIWDGIKAYFVFALTFYQTLFSSIWTGIKVAIITVWTAIKNSAIAIWSGIKNYFITMLQIYETLFRVAWETIKTIISTVLNVIKSVIVSVWTGIESTITGILHGIESVLSSVWNGIKSTTSSVFNGIKSTAQSVWNGIKDAIITPVQKAKDKVITLIETIKGAFNFSWKLPKLKVPSVSVDMKKNSWGIPYPDFDITWHKTGGVFTQPVVAGNAGFGDVEEGIVPFEGPHAMKIAKLIAAAQNKLQDVSSRLADKIIQNVVKVYVEAGDVIMDGKTVGKVVWRPVKQEIDSYEARP